jgi:hypothetical protein
MAAKQLLFKDEARAKILEGVETLTLSEHGRPDGARGGFEDQ